VNAASNQESPGFIRGEDVKETGVAKAILSRLGGALRSRRAPSSPEEIVDQFHQIYYDAEQDGGTWRDTYFMGVPTRKCPLDLWVYQEMIFELKPDLIIECGTASGGSALYLASICELLGTGHVVSVDIESNADLPMHPRIKYLVGSSTSDEVVAQVGEIADRANQTLVILDSDHSRDHVLRELHMYAPLVSTGSYIIVEDSNVNGHPVVPSFGPGPMEAIEEFLIESDEFEVDRRREKFLLTFNPRGFLRKR